jgi:LPS sulfotransferase NodH
MPEQPGAATRFVILAAPRSGSNLLCTLLNSHPGILCHHEVFNPGGIFYAIDHRDGSLNLGTIEERDHDPAAFLERLWRELLGRACVGFKMTRGQHEGVFASVLHDPGLRKIILRRRNRVKTYVSTLVAEQSGQWEVYRAADLIEPRPKVTVNLADLNKQIAENQAYYATIDGVLQSSGQRSFQVAYEDLGSESEHRRLLDYLGASCRSLPLAARSVKQNPADLRPLVTNYDEILSEFRDTELVAELCSLRP